MRAVALLRLIARCHFSHGVVGRGAAMLRMRFDAVPLNHYDDPTRVLDAGKKLDAVGAGVIRFLQYVRRRLGCTRRVFRVRRVE